MDFFIILFKLAERVADFTKTVLIVNPKKLKKLIESPLHKRDCYLASESGDVGIHEIVLEQRRVQDTKPVHASICILQNSKLMLLQFVDFIKKFLIPNSYAFVYGGNRI